MTRRCSHCSHNGHNSRTCPNRGVKLFGVRLTDGSIRKSASMGNLSHYAGSSSGGGGGGGGGGCMSPADGHEGGGDGAGGGADGYASEDFVQGSSSGCRERKKGVPWTEEEHRMFLLGLQKLGKGDWRGIARNYVVSRTPTQVASHAQKYFIRLTNASRRKRRSSLFDIVPDESAEEHQPLPSYRESETHDDEQLVEPPSLDEGCESMDSTNSNDAETVAPRPEISQCSYPMVFPAYFSPFFPYPFPLWPGYRAESHEQEPHEIIKPTAVHSKTPIDVDELVGISKLSLRDPLVEHMPDFSQKLQRGADRQSAFHPNPAARSSSVDTNSSTVHALL